MPSPSVGSSFPALGVGFAARGALATSAPAICFASLLSVLPACNTPIVSLDTLRADRLGAYGNTDGLTPNLDHFARESFVFTHAYSQATLTAPSHATLFTSRYPSEEAGPQRPPDFGDDKPRLAQVLQLYGYQTGAFVGGGDLNKAMGFADGFDVYQSPVDFGSLWHTVPLALDWIDKRDGSKPFFLFVHGYDAHARYLKPAPLGYSHADQSQTGPGDEAVKFGSERVADHLLFPDLAAIQHVHEILLRSRNDEGKEMLAETGQYGEEPAVPMTDQDLSLLTGVYNSAVTYGDVQFGRLMVGLQAAGALDEAWIFVIADHGEQLGEDGLFQHCCGLGDAETHVPLMVRPPNNGVGGDPALSLHKIEEQVGLIDVMPTIVELSRVTAPAGMAGHPFTKALQNEVFEGDPYVFTQGNDRMRSVSVRTPKGRLTYTGISATSPFLPPLLEVARLNGPGFVADETPDQTDGDTALPDSEREAMRTAMVIWLKGLAPSPKERREDLPSELKDALKKHGYWGIDQ
jgi:arylsulfatase A-like enzyme